MWCSETDTATAPKIGFIACTAKGCHLAVQCTDCCKIDTEHVSAELCTDDNAGALYIVIMQTAKKKQVCPDTTKFVQCILCHVL